MALSLLRGHRRLVAKSVAEDLAQLAEEVAQEAEGAAERGDFATLFALTRRLRSGHDRPHPAVLDRQGTLLTEPSAIEARWTEHWCEHLAGSTVEYGDLVQSNHRPLPGPEVPRLPHVQLDTIESMLHHSSVRKATGLDEVGASSVVVSSE